MNVELRDLSIGYRNKQTSRVVVRDINATIGEGRLTCLLGANGVGKSTLLRTLSAFQPKMGGEIMIGEREIGSYTARELSRLIGVVLTEKPDVRNMTARELVSTGRSPYTGFWGSCSQADYDAVDEALRQVGCTELSVRQIDTLSDGERQKVMIAKALAQETDIIYLDEPTAFLDFPSKVEVMLLLRRICQEQEKTVFLSTHDLELALQIADCIWLIDRKNGLHIGSPRALADEGVLGQFVERGGTKFDRETMTIRIDKSA